jgi:Ca2+-binding RTX toxin-like protein
MASVYGDDNDNTSNSGLFNLYYGGGGDDLMAGSTASDEIYGGEGNDTLFGAPYNAPPTGAGTLADPKVLVPASDSGDDLLEGGSGADAIYGLDGDDRIYGGDGDDSGISPSLVGFYFTAEGHVGQGLFGGTGNDYSEGGRGNDLIDGGVGDDELYGGAGDDEILGGGGKDDMAGGSGVDTFVFLSLADLRGDRIDDFNRKEDDIIDLSGIDAKPGGKHNPFKFVGDDSFTRKGQMSFNNDKLKFNTDNDKKAEATMIVNSDKLAKGDFDLDV